MSRLKRTFVQECVHGDATPSAIDDFVERWHAGEGEGTLAEYLGFTAAEYAAWVEDPDRLASILDAYRKKAG